MTNSTSTMFMPSMAFSKDSYRAPEVFLEGVAPTTVIPSHDDGFDFSSFDPNPDMDVSDPLDFLLTEEIADSDLLVCDFQTEAAIIDSGDHPIVSPVKYTPPPLSSWEPNKFPQVVHSSIPSGCFAMPHSRELIPRTISNLRAMIPSLQCEIRTDAHVVGPDAICSKETYRRQKVKNWLVKRRTRRYNRGVTYECRRQVAVRRPRVNGRFAGFDFTKHHVGDPGSSSL